MVEEYISPDFTLGGLLTIGTLVGESYSHSRMIKGDIVLFNPTSLGAELVDGWTNLPGFPYETFNTVGSEITLAINTVGFAICYKDIGAVQLGEVYRAAFTYTSFIGATLAPYFQIARTNQSESPYNFSRKFREVSLTGTKDYVFYWVVTIARANEYACFFCEGPEANFSITSFSLKKVLGGAIIAPGDIMLGNPASKQGFYGKDPIVQQVLATGAGHTADDIITFLQSIGLVKQA